MPVRPAANNRPAAILLAMKNFLLIIKLLDLNRQTAGSLREPGGLPDWIKHQKIRWAIGVIISRLMMVLSRKITKSPNIPMGIFEPRISPPISDR